MPVRCCRSIEDGQSLVIGTNFGVCISHRLSPAVYSEPIRVLRYGNVTQLEVVAEHNLLLVLADKALFALHLATLDNHDLNSSSKRGRRICHCNHFVVNNTAGWICCVKRSEVESHIKYFDLQAGSDDQLLLQLKGDLRWHMGIRHMFWIDGEIHFCGTSGIWKGDLEHLMLQPLADSFDAPASVRTGMKPIFVEQQSDHSTLLCYPTISFHTGDVARMTIKWEEGVQNFATLDGGNIVVGFRDDSIEVRDATTAMLKDWLRPFEDVRLLQRSEDEILFSYRNGPGTDAVASLQCRISTSSPELNHIVVFPLVDVENEM